MSRIPSDEVRSCRLPHPPLRPDGAGVPNGVWRQSSVSEARVRVPYYDDEHHRFAFANLNFLKPDGPERISVVS